MMSNQQEPNHDSLLARIDALATEALGVVERSDLDARIAHALRLVAEGRLSYRVIARECDDRAPGRIQRAAPRFGLLIAHEVHRQQLPEAREIQPRVPRQNMRGCYPGLVNATGSVGLSSRARPRGARYRLVCGFLLPKRRAHWRMAATAVSRRIGLALGWALSLTPGRLGD